MNANDIKCSTATNFTDLESFAGEHKCWIFRGMRCPEWKLETSIERAAKRVGADRGLYERDIFNEFRRHAQNYLPRVPRTEDTLEWLALMQHYGAPTRLLDFTYSFWIALFFAFEDADSSCAVWAIAPGWLKHDVRDLNPVIHTSIFEDHGIDSLYADVPYFTNERLAIQKGIFVFSLGQNSPFHELLTQFAQSTLASQPVVEKLTVAAQLLPQIRERLNEYNCNSRTLFPGIDGYGRYFKNHTLDTIDSLQAHLG